MNKNEKNINTHTHTQIMNINMKDEIQTKNTKDYEFFFA